MTTTSKAGSEELIEARRLRLERLLQICAREFDLRFEFGEADALGRGEIVMGIVEHAIPRADDRILKGMAMHLLGHYLSDGAEWVTRANRQEAGGKPHFTRLWHALEDARLERQLIDRWPGVRKHLDAKLPSRLGGKLVRLTTRTRQIEWGLYLFGRGFDVSGLSPEVRDLLLQGLGRIEEAAGAETAQGSWNACQKLYPILAPHLRGQMLQPPPRPLDKRRERDETPSHLSEENAGQTEKTDEPELSSMTPRERRPAPPVWTVPGSSPWFERGRGEKAIHESARRTDRQTMIVPPLGEPSAYFHLQAQVQREAGFLAKRLKQMIRERLYLRYQGRYHSGKLDMARLWKQRTGSHRLFQRRDEGDARQVAFCLLVDESASMKRGDKSQMAAKAAVMLGEALDELDVPLEIIGFSTAQYEAHAAMALGLTPPHKYRNTRCSALEHRIYKSFAEAYSAVGRRMVHIQPRFNNWDEEHLLFALRRIQARRARRRVILVISDGQPNGDATHMIEAVRRAERHGVEVVGIGIGADYVRQIYRASIVVDDFKQLAQELVEVVSRPFRTPHMERAA